MRGRRGGAIRIEISIVHALTGLLAMALLIPAATAAQARQDSVLLRGQVVEEETAAPIAFASLRILDDDLRLLGRTETDREGYFTFVVREQTGVHLESERIGYEATRTPFLWFDGHDYFELEVRLDREVVLLAPLEVLGRRRMESPILESFKHRTRLGMGWYITRDEIQARNPSRVTDLLMEAPGVRLASSGLGLRRVVEMRGASAGGCPVQVYIDGMHLNKNDGPADLRVVAIDDFVSPESVLGIEIYRGLATVPAEFLNTYAKCGVVALWTLRGGNESE